MSDYLKLAEETIISTTEANPTEKPQAIFLVGQPGSGKSSLIEMLPYKDNSIFIDGDKYRSNYDDVNNLQKNNIYQYLRESGKVSGETVEYLINQLSNKKYNLIIEGTLRTSEVPIKTAKLLTKKGYQCQMIVIVMHPAESLLRTIKRYINLEQTNYEARESPSSLQYILPRPVEPQHHDNVVKNIPINLQTVANSKLFANIDLYQNNQLIYRVEGNSVPTSISLTYKKTLNNTMTRNTYKRITREIKKVKSDIDELYKNTDIHTLLSKEELLKAIQCVNKHLETIKERSR